MSKRFYNLFIVGNGFDVACGYKTKYANYLNPDFSLQTIGGFRTSFVNVETNGYFETEDWNSFEKILCRFLSYISFLFTSKKVNRKFRNEGYDNNRFIIEVNISDIDDIFMRLMIRDFTMSFKDIFMPYINNSRVSSYNLFYNYIYDSELDDAKLELVSLESFKNTECSIDLVEKKYIKRINEYLEKLEENLKEYIKLETSKDPSPSYLLQYIKDNYEIGRLLSFNYSYCAENFFEIPNDRVMHIHGDVNNDIVIGIENNMLRDQNITIDSNYSIFFKRLRRIYKDSSFDFDKCIVQHIDSNSAVGIFGHSLDLSDKSIFEIIFKKRCARYDIYCYEDKNEYKTRIFNILGIELFEELYMAGKINFIEIPKE